MLIYWHGFGQVVAATVNRVPAKDRCLVRLVGVKPSDPALLCEHDEVDGEGSGLLN